MPNRFGVHTSLFYFFYFWATAVFVIFVPKTLIGVGYSAFEVGVLLSTMPLIRFATPFVFSGKIKLDKKSFIVSLLMSAISFGCFAFTYQSFWLLLINTAAYGIFVSVTLPYIDSVALSNVKKESYGYIRLFGSIGFIGAALIIGHGELEKIAVYLHYFVSVAIMGIFGVFAVLSAQHLPKPEKKENASEFYLYKNDAYFWLSAILAQLSFGAFYAFFTVFETERGMEVSDVTMLWSVGVVAEIVMFLFQGSLLKKLEPLFIMKLSIAVLVVRWLALDIFAGDFAAAFVAQLTHALTFALYTTAAFVFVFSRYKNKTMAQMQFYGLSYGLGGFFGSLFAGKFYGDNLFLYSALFAAASLFALFRYKPTAQG